jgi:hypothetical protein
MEDARQISQNLVDYFKILAEWDMKHNEQICRKEAAQAKR